MTKNFSSERGSTWCIDALMVMVIHDDWTWGYHHDDLETPWNPDSNPSGRPGWPPLLVENRCHTIALSQTPRLNNIDMENPWGNPWGMIWKCWVFHMSFHWRTQIGTCQNESVDVQEGASTIYHHLSMDHGFHSMLDHQRISTVATPPTSAHWCFINPAPIRCSHCKSASQRCFCKKGKKTYWNHQPLNLSQNHQRSNFRLVPSIPKLLPPHQGFSFFGSCGLRLGSEIPCIL